MRARAWMLVFSSALRTWSPGPRGWPCQVPAYRSRIGPAFSAKRGSRGKIQYWYCHGLMASRSRMRHTVVRPMNLPKACRARCVTSVMLEAGWNKFCDRIVYIHAPQATRLARLAQQRGWTAKEVQARTQAQLPLTDKVSRADAAIDNSGPPAETALALLGQVRVLVQQEGEATPLDALLRGGLAPQGVPGFGQEVVRESRTKGRQRAGHGGPPFREGKKEPPFCCLSYDIFATLTSIVEWTTKPAPPPPASPRASKKSRVANLTG